MKDALGGYDVYVGMQWRRMGTPTGGWRSGTEAELRYALRQYQAGARPRKLYFYVKAVRGGAVREPGVDEFTADVYTLGLTQVFRHATELRRMLVGHLSEPMREM